MATCGECGKHFDTIHGLRTHFGMVHKNEPKIEWKRYAVFSGIMTLLIMGLIVFIFSLIL